MFFAAFTSRSWAAPQTHTHFLTCNGNSATAHSIEHLFDKPALLLIR